jgi:protein tyrosine phosphatase (PTP) superfamily phosphohydrolase (DUF442 family)
MAHSGHQLRRIVAIEQAGAHCIVAHRPDAVAVDQPPLVEFDRQAKLSICKNSRGQCGATIVAHVGH